MSTSTLLKAEYEYKYEYVCEYIFYDIVILYTNNNIF